MAVCRAAQWAVGLALGAGAFLATADSVEIQVGASHSAQVGASGVVWAQNVGWSEPLEWAPRWRHEPVGTLAHVGGRTEVGYGDGVWLVGIGERLRWQGAEGGVSPWFVEGQLLLAKGRTSALSGPLQFATAAGWTQGGWLLLVRHVSNAGIQGENRGETMLLVGRSF